MSESKRYEGGCHCGQVRYDVSLDLSQPLLSCNCSICLKAAMLLAFVPAEQFNLQKGAEHIADYQFGKKAIHHLFCATCGIRSFGKGTMPDGTEMCAINVRCLDGIELDGLPVMKVDGKSF